MGLKEIEKEIRKSGEEEIKKINVENNEIIKNIKSDINAEAEAKYTQTKSRRVKELLIIPKKIISDAQIYKRKEISVKRAEILEKVFEKVRERILKMNDAEKKKILDNFIAHYSEKVGEIDHPVIFIDKKYANLLKNANKNFKIEKKEIGDFGVIIESKDGSLRIDNTLKSVVDRVRVRLEPEIVKILFHEN